MKNVGTLLFSPKRQQRLDYFLSVFMVVLCGCVTQEILIREPYLVPEFVSL